MKRFALVALLAAMLFGVASSASAGTELKVKGHLDVYGMWSANLNDHDTDFRDGDNYMTSQRMRTFFTYVANENLKAVLGLEIDNIWGNGGAADWGTDGKGNIEVKHAYLDFNFPDTEINVKAGLQYVALPGVFGNPVFDDDAAAIVVSAPINEAFALALGYTRGADSSTSVSNSPTKDGVDKDNMDMAFLAAPITLDGFGVTPYFAYARIGENVDFKGQQGVTSQGRFTLDDGADIWVLGAHATLTMFDPLTFAADLIYGEGKDDDYDTKGWYAALAASYKFDVLTATLFTTYGSGAKDDDDKDRYLPTLAEGWGLTPYLGGVRAFGTTWDSFATDNLGVGSDGTGIWTVGLALDDITFVDNLSHKLVLAYARGTGSKETSLFTKEDHGFEIYLVNKYMIYENLAAINELGFFKGSSEVYDDLVGNDLDASYFATIGFQYKF
ncbi:outer membrane homotrimeric porin [Desulfovibrionales bacterium]